MSRLPVRIRCEACPRTFLWEPSMHRLCDGCLIRKEKLEAKRAKEEAEGANILNRNAVRRLTESVEKLKAELKRNLDVLADSYSKTRAGRYASLSKEARQARLDLLTQIYSRMGGGLIHERADELDREEPLDESATGGSNVR